MKKTLRIISVLSLALAIACGGTSDDGTASEPVAESGGGETTVEVLRDDEELAPVTGVAQAQMSPTEGNTVSGSITFTPVDGAVEVAVELSGFEPGTTHGFHVHEVGDCSAPDGTSAGGHFNPAGVDHALPETHTRHAGDLGNVVADEEGNVSTTQVFDGLALLGENSIVGRGVIVHASADDGGQPTGNAGARISCGVIEAL